MRVSRTLVAMCVAGLAIGPAVARGAGYGLYEQGAAVLGMGGAGTASVNDPSAVFFNPAAMIGLDGTRIYGGGTFLQSFTSFAGAAPYPGFGVVEEMEPTRVFPPTAYLTHRYAGPWAIGLGLNAPYGLKVEWKDYSQFTGRYIVIAAELKTTNVSLAAAREFGKKKTVSFGFGGNLVYTRATLVNREFIADPGGGGGQREIAQKGLVSDLTPGYGWNAGLRWTPWKDWRFGLTYRSRIVVHAAGKLDITQFPTGDPQLDALVSASLPPDQVANTVLRMPSIGALGAAWNWGENVTIEGDAVYTGWSAFEDIPIHLQSTPSASNTIVENYDDSFQFRVGAEHRLQAFTYRVGYYFDQAAAPTESVSPTLPDSDRHGVTLGFGMGLLGDKRLTLDVYQLALFVQNRKTEGVNRDGYEGEYKSFASATGLSLAYRW